jgi:hypothetical protein
LPVSKIFNHQRQSDFLNKSNFYVGRLNFFEKWGLLIVLSFIIGGCDIFNTRNAETPTQPKSDFIPAATEDLLIQNLISSFRDKDVTNYLLCLSDTSFTNKKFFFSPSNEAASTYPTLMDWNRSSEDQYFRNMSVKVSSNSQIDLILNESSRNNFGNDSTFYTASYELKLPYANASSEVTWQIYEGTLTFKMVRDKIRSVWSIYYWQDNKTGTNPSWSDLKGSMAN